MAAAASASAKAWLPYIWAQAVAENWFESSQFHRNRWRIVFVIVRTCWEPLWGASAWSVLTPSTVLLSAC